MSARERVLSKVRAALGAKGEAAARQRAVAERLEAAPRGIVPARADRPEEARLALFKELATKANATVAEVADYAALPAAVSAYLRERNLPAALRMGDDPRLAAAPFETERTLEVRRGPSDGQDAVGLSHALAGIAETGTLALTAGGDNPTTLNFLPEHHIVAVSRADIVADMESVWDRLRAAHGKGAMPRAVNLVTGPSRSGDIEQTILLGAHGPRSLHILLVG